MTQKFNLYDILSYLVNGTLVLWGIFYALKVLPLKYALFDFDNAFLNTTFFVFMAYLLGNVIQAVARQYQDRVLYPAWGGMPSQRFLKPENNYLPDSFKEQIVQAAIEHFSIKRPRNCEERQDLFNRCYVLVRDKNASEKVFFLLSMYGFFRGLIVASAMNVLIFGSLAYWHYSNNNLWDMRTSLVVAIGFLIIIYLGHVRVKQRAEAFAEAVLRSFLRIHQELMPHIDNK